MKSQNTKSFAFKFETTNGVFLGSPTWSKSIMNSGSFVASKREKSEIWNLKPSDDFKHQA